MNILPDNVMLYEVIWLIVSLPGLVLWTMNRVVAEQSYRAVRRFGLDEDDGRLLWARFARTVTNLFIVIEIVFIILGVLAMIRPEERPLPDAFPIVVVVALLFVSTFISFVAWRWRAIEKKLFEAALAAPRAVPPRVAPPRVRD